jgi:D-sedoheptulose 7-phosphate isomerase
MKSLSLTTAQYLKKLSKTLASIKCNEMDHALDVIEKAWRSGKQIITLGNGGSAMTSLHFINDWNKSIYLSTKIPFRGRSLVDNMGLVMSYSNDISFDDVFIEQLKNILQPDDLVLAISGSGNSENVIRAVEYANKQQAVTLGLCGYNGGKLKDKAQHVVWIEAYDMQIVEDVHAIFGHIVMQRLCGYSRDSFI